MFIQLIRILIEENLRQRRKTQDMKRKEQKVEMKKISNMKSNQS
jgi:hypothetical protein